MIEYISQPWHWSISGLMIVFVMFILLYMGQAFGVSSSFKAVCSMVAGRKSAEYFDYDWKSHSWLLIFVLGGIIGGAIGSTIMASPDPVNISAATIQDLKELGIAAPSVGLAPGELFNFDFLLTWKGLILFVLGGFLIGFGTRWAGGCTSGHAISGLSNLQLPSLVAVIGFFVGGLLSTFVIYPIIF